MFEKLNTLLTLKKMLKSVLERFFKEDKLRCILYLTMNTMIQKNIMQIKLGRYDNRSSSY